jgi:stearoyl-CoA desaturase (delta-9 desaturase)
MSMQLNSTTKLEPIKRLPGNSRTTIASDYLQVLQRRFALATVLIPFIGSVVAIGLLWLSDIGLVEVGLLVSMYILTFVGITVGFHRHFAHKAFQTSTVVRIILVILGSMAAQGPIIHWVSNHRRHHEYSDQPGDPHSPYLYKGETLGQLRGLWHAHIGWLFDSEITNSALFAKDLLRDSAIAKVNRLYLIWVLLGLAIPALLGGVLTLSWMGIFNGFLWGGLVRLFLAHHFSWSVVSISHFYGSRPFDTRDQSTNNSWLAMLNFGEAWHNNHHAFPNSAIFGLKWWQIDLGGWVIRALEKAGLVWDVKMPTAKMIEVKRRAI